MKEGQPVRTTLFPDKAGESVTHTLRELRSQTHEFPARRKDPKTPESAGEAKTETYALIAFILEKIQPRMEIAMKAHYEDPQYLAVGDREVHLRESLTPENPNFMDSLARLEVIYPYTFITQFDEWRKETERAPTSFEAQAYKRLLGLLGNSELGLRSQVRSNQYIARDFIARGAGTAGEVSWQTLRAIPITYQQRFGRTITSEEFNALADSALPLVTTLSSMHLYNFTQLQYFAEHSRNIYPGALHVEIPAEFFEITESPAGALTMGFNAETLAIYRIYFEKRMRERGQMYYGDEERLGCPARDARVIEADGRSESVLASAYGMYREFANRYLIPHLEPYTKATTEVLAQEHALYS